MSRTTRVECAAVAALVVCWGASRARSADVEPNDTLGTAQVVAGNAAGETLTAGELLELPFTFPDGATISEHTLAAGQVNSHDIAGLPPGAAVLAHLDNTVGLVGPDTVMRALDEFGDEVAFDDDLSFLGDGLASGILTTVNADGSLHLEVSGYADFDFDGIDDFDGTPHIEFGEYELAYQLGPFGDVDYFRITDLQPGSMYLAETRAAAGEDPIDTVLTQFDGGGGIVDQNDDIDFDADNFLSRLSGLVPADGQVLLAVTAYPDYTNVGGHLWFGDYGLYLTYKVVPEPSGFAIMLSVAVIAPYCLGGRGVARRPLKQP
jgi:hypothetical protein